MRHRLAVIVLLLVVGAAFAAAQEHAVLVLKSGERVDCDLVDLGAPGFTVKVNSASRQIPMGEVAIVEFAPGKKTSAPLGSEHLLVMRNGDVIHGQLMDIGGTHPLRITFRAVGKDRDYSSNDISRIVLGVPERK